MDLPHPVPDGSECWDATDRIVVDLDAERPTRLAAQFEDSPKYDCDFMSMIAAIMLFFSAVALAAVTSLGSLSYLR